MHYRALGKTGITVSEVGMGCNRLGQDYAPDEHWINLVRRAADLDVTIFDTSFAYGWGRSEDIVQITYNIFRPEAEERLFDLAERCGVGLLCRMPMARGVLTGKFRPGQQVPGDHRAHLDADQLLVNIERAEVLRPVAARYPGGMTRMALHYALTPSAVSAIIPGARTVAQLEENIAASNGSGLPADLRDEIQRLRAGW